MRLSDLAPFSLLNLSHWNSAQRWLLKTETYIIRAYKPSLSISQRPCIKNQWGVSLALLGNLPILCGQLCHMSITVGSGTGGRASWPTVSPDWIEVLGLSPKMQIGHRHEQNEWTNTVIIIAHFRWVECCKVMWRQSICEERVEFGLECKCG